MQILQNPCQFLQSRATLGLMSDDDETLWAAFAKDIKELKKPPALPADSKPARAVPKAEKTTVPRPPPVVQLTQAPQGFELDGRTQERFLSGKLPIDGRIDLHGMTQDQAHRALGFFIQEALHKRWRMLLVITGKGRGGMSALECDATDWLAPTPGVLRQNLPRWLQAPDIRPHILKIAPAQRQHGGDGAFYVYLRRRRD